MIKLFRKIRRNLLIKNKIRTYLKYAIGEIILVVIGILIALQINNWNEDRKLQKEEIRILNNLQVDLQQTLIELESALVFHQKTITEIDKIEHYIKNKTPYSEAIESSFGLLPHYYVALITSSSYTSLQSIGVGIIKNNKLKDLLINTYDVALADILDYNADEFQLQTTLVTPFFSKNFRYMDKSLYHAKPNNCDDLMTKHWRFQGTHDGDLFGIPATNNKVDIYGVTLVVMKNGKIFQEKYYFDNNVFMKQLGLME